MIEVTQANMKLLLLGFISSIVLILAAYFGVTYHWFSGMQLMSFVFGLAMIEALVQLVCFLHLGLESKPYWHLIMFIVMAILVVVIVAGSMWIMYHLNYNMMLP